MYLKYFGFFLFNQMQCYTSILFELMYGFLFIRKGKHGFAFVTFFKNFIEKWFSSSAFVYMFKTYTYVVWHTTGLQEDVFSFCTYVTTAPGFFTSNFFTSYKINLDFLFLPSMPDRIISFAGQHLSALLTWQTA